MADLAADLETLYAEVARVPPEEYVEIVKNPRQIIERFARLVARARDHVYTMTRPPYLMAPPATERPRIYDETLTAMKRGVRFLSLYETPPDPDPVLLEVANHFAALGERIRFAPRVPMKIFVADGREVVISLEDPSTAAPTITSLVIEHHALAGACEMLFEKLWEEAVPFTAA